MTIPVLVAVTGATEALLVTGLERSAAQVRVVRRCADLAELLSAAGAGVGRAAVVSADLPRLDRDAVARLHAAGVAVIGLADAADPGARQRLVLLGVRLVLAADTPPDAVARLVTEVAGTPSSPPPVPPADPADALRPLPAGGASAAGPAPRATASGQVIAVWGPAGAPGRTSVAVGLATELAALGLAVLLVDADTYGPSVAQTLALLDESAGLAMAVRAANQGTLDPGRLLGLAPEALPGLRVLTGLPRPSRWPELRASGLEVVWRCARDASPWTVVDCGFGLETDEEVSFDTAAPRRNAATLSALAAADLILAVGSGEPIGLQRLVRGWQELAEVRPPGTPVRAVVTRVREAAVGGDPGRRVTQALSRYAGIGDPVLIPDDRPGYDAAMLSGRALVEAAPQSRARLALADLAATLVAQSEQAGLAVRAAHPAGRVHRRARRLRSWVTFPGPAGGGPGGGK